jgi:hypothetical protein
MWCHRTSSDLFLELVLLHVAGITGGLGWSFGVISDRLAKFAGHRGAPLSPGDKTTSTRKHSLCDEALSAGTGETKFVTGVDLDSRFGIESRSRMGLAWVLR